MKHLPALVVALIFATCATAAAVDAHYTVLHGAEAAKALHQCSRPTAEGITGIWDPPVDVIRQLESNLPHLSQLASTNQYGVSKSIGDPKFSYRQYVGIVIGGRRYIYINAENAEFSRRENGAWLHNAAVVCDGGPSLWGALYDTQTGEFSALEGNGVG